jgi:O-antigen/teichoic acid export membrane protein
MIYNEGFKKYSKNTAWLLSEKILRIFSSLVVGIWVTRYLGPSDFGVLAYAQSYVALFASIATFGLNEILVRELIRNEKEENEILATSLFIRFLGAITALILLCITLFFSSSSKNTILIIFIIAFSILFKSLDVFVFYFQSKVLSKYVVFSNLISNLISSILKIVLIIYDAPLVSFAYVLVLDSLILSFFLSFFFFKNTKIHIKDFVLKKMTAILLLKDSWPLLLSGLVVTISLKVDQLMISWILGDAAVGKYAAASRLSEAWYFIPMAISGSLFPAIIKAKKIDKELYIKRLQMLLNLMVVLALSIAIPMTFLSDWLVNILYGAEFFESGNVLMIHIWSGVFIFLSIANGSWLINENLQIYYFIFMTLGAVLNVILNYVFIDIFGIVAAAWANLATYFFSTYICLLFFKKTRISFIYLTKSLLLIDIIKTLNNSFKKCFLR